MKNGFRRIGFSILFGLLLPIVTLYTALSVLPESQPEVLSEPSETVLPESSEESAASASAITVPVLMENGKTEEMALDNYLAGVLLAEMPAEFEPEALKAQAVVSATYVLRRTLVRDKHNGAVCTDSGCCQAWRDPESYLSEGGTQENLEKIRDAVEAVSGQVLTYNGDPIEATFFSCSGGFTEAAVAVWGSDVPYLQATPSPGEEIAVHNQDILSFSGQELENALGIALSGPPEDWFSHFSYTDGGGVASAEVGGTEFTGVELRKLLGLRSTNFSVTPSGDGITITTHGFGHRVGMSQYGAQAMALSGASYDEILAHYYKGTELSPWGN